MDIKKVLSFSPHKPKILLVDDRQSNLDALISLLQDFNTELLTATSGNEALELSLKHQLALVLMDVQMPGMDGFETAQVMHSRKDTPIIFITAFSRERQNILEGYDSGAVDYLVKPFDSEILKRKVKVFLLLDHQKMLLEQSNRQLETEIDRRQKAEQELKKASEHLEDLVKERTDQLTAARQEIEDFVYSVSHDLKAPLRSINGFAEIISRRHKDTLNDKGRHYFDNIIKASSLMARSVDDLLQYLRLGRKNVKAGKIEPRTLLSTIIGTQMKEQFEQTQAEITFPEQMPVILGDAFLITEIFKKLLDNSLKYHQPGQAPKITVDFEDTGNQIIIRFADEGIGIPPEFHEKVFNTFQRLHHPHGEIPGTGIGLAVVKKAARIMKWNISVESEPERGSVFSISAPKAPSIQETE